MKPSDIKSIATVIGKLFRVQFDALKADVDRLLKRLEEFETKETQKPAAPTVEQIAAEVIKQSQLPTIDQIVDAVLKKIALPTAKEIAAEVSVPSPPSIEDICAMVIRNLPSIDQIVLQTRAHIPSAEEIGKHVSVPTGQEIAALVELPSLPSAEDVAAIVMRDLPINAICNQVRESIVLPSADEIAKLVPVPTIELPEVPIDQIIENIKSLIPTPIKGDKGEPCKPEDVREMVKEIIDAYLEAMPKPKDGSSVSVDDVLPSIENHFSKWALEFERRASDRLNHAIETMPKAQNGHDGLGFDDLRTMQAEQTEDRLITLFVTRGPDRIDLCQIKLSHPLHRGVFSEGKEYQRGDQVTRDGCAWIALKDQPQGMPGSSDDWQLAVKKGRDGKDGTMKSPPPTQTRVAPRKE